MILLSFYSLLIARVVGKVGEAGEALGGARKRKTKTNPFTWFDDIFGFFYTEASRPGY